MIEFKEFETLQRVINKLKRERDELAGVLKQEKLELKKKYGCNTLAEAKKLLKKKNKEIDREERKFLKNLNQFLVEHRIILKRIAKEDYLLLRRVAEKAEKSKARKEKKKRTKKKD